YLASFILSIVAMSQRRIASGITLLLANVIGAPVLFIIALAIGVATWSCALEKARQRAAEHSSTTTTNRVEDGSPAAAVSEPRPVAERPVAAVTPAVEKIEGAKRTSVEGEARAHGESSYPAPSDQWQQTEDGAILTLPGGQKFVSQALIDKGEVRLTFPTGQTFVSESAKGDETPPLVVSKDGTLVVVERHPATQSGDIHIYIKEAAGNFEEIPDVNEQIDKLLKGVKGAWGGQVLWLRSLSDHSLTLWSVALKAGQLIGK